MEKDGLIQGEQVRWGPRSTKTQYSITDDGIAAFRAWMNTPLDHAPERDAHHMQAAYFEWADPDRAREILHKHIEYYSTQVELLTAVRDGIKAGTDPAIVRRLDHYPAHEHQRIIAYKAYTYDGMIARSRSEIDWAHKGLALLDELAGTESSPRTTTMTGLPNTRSLCTRSPARVGRLRPAAIPFLVRDFGGGLSSHRSGAAPSPRHRACRRRRG